MFKANVNCNVLKEYLDFLTKQGLVEEKIIGREKIVYGITQRGITELKQLRELQEVFPIVEETVNWAKNQGSSMF